MSILIKGMEMPASCQKCVCSDDGGRYCNAAHEFIPMMGRPSFCPLIEIQPHGRLIDADALMARFEKEEKAADEHGRDFSFSFKSAGENCAEWWSVQQMLFDAPTIIPAEEGE